MMIQTACPNCDGSIFSESFKAEGNYYIEFTCVQCASLWTPRTMHEITEAILLTGDLGKAERVDRELNLAIRRESKDIPARLRVLD